MKTEERQWDVEETTRRVLQQAERTPPADAWDRIASQLASGQPSGRRRPRWPWAVGLGAVAGLSLWLLWPKAHEEPAVAVRQTQLEAPSQQQDEPRQSLPADVAPRSTTAAVENAPSQSAATHASAPLPTHAAEPPRQQVAEGPTEDFAAYDAAAEQLLATATPAPPVAASPRREASPAATRDEGSYDASQTAPSPVADSAATLLVPNLLTPNGDGINDCWTLTGVEQYAPVHVRICSPRGRVLFEHRNYDNTFCGEGIPDGNYFYVLSLAGGRQTRRGVLVIKRQ